MSLSFEELTTMIQFEARRRRHLGALLPMKVFLNPCWKEQATQELVADTPFTSYVSFEFIFDESVIESNFYIFCETSRQPGGRDNETNMFTNGN